MNMSFTWTGEHRSIISSNADRRRRRLWRAGLLRARRSSRAIRRRRVHALTQIVSISLSHISRPPSLARAKSERELLCELIVHRFNHSVRFSGRSQSCSRGVASPAVCVFLAGNPALNCHFQRGVNAEKNKRVSHLHYSDIRPVNRWTPRHCGVGGSALTGEKVRSTPSRNGVYVGPVFGATATEIGHLNFACFIRAVVPANEKGYDA